MSTAYAPRLYFRGGETPFYFLLPPSSLFSMQKQAVGLLPGKREQVHQAEYRKRQTHLYVISSVLSAK